MYKLVIFMAMLTACTATQTTPVRKCQNFKEQLYKQVVVNTPKGICTKLPCVLPSGSNITTDITFDVKTLVEQITMNVNATVAGSVVKYPVPNGEKACDWLTNTFCPVEKGTEAEMRFILPVLRIFPKIRVSLTLFMTNQSNKVISCFEVDIQVV